jgi:hypothetical protein
MDAGDNYVEFKTWDDLNCASSYSANCPHYVDTLKDLPFALQTAGTEVTVGGTKFTVSSAALQNGRVRVTFGSTATLDITNHVIASINEFSCGRPFSTDDGGADIVAGTCYPLHQVVLGAEYQTKISSGDFSSKCGQVPETWNQGTPTNMGTLDSSTTSTKGVLVPAGQPCPNDISGLCTHNSGGGATCTKDAGARTVRENAFTQIFSASPDQVNQFFQDNIVLAVIFCSLLAWIPCGCLIHRYDRKQRKLNANYGLRKFIHKDHNKHNYRGPGGKHPGHPNGARAPQRPPMSYRNRAHPQARRPHAQHK